MDYAELIEKVTQLYRANSNEVPQHLIDVIEKNRAIEKAEPTEKSVLRDAAKRIAQNVMYGTKNKKKSN